MLQACNWKIVSTGLEMQRMFGRRLREVRESKGISGYKLAQLSGIIQQSLSAIEHGKRDPSEANIRALAAVPELGISYETLKAWPAGLLS